METRASRHFLVCWGTHRSDQFLRVVVIKKSVARLGVIFVGLSTEDTDF